MRRALFALVALTVVSCDGDGGGPTTVEDPRVAGVLVSPGAARLSALGATTTIHVVVIDQFGQPMSDVALTWTSDSTGVATVADGGVVTAVANGSTKVTASADGISGSSVITVSQSVASVAIDSASAGLSSLGATVQLMAEVRDAGGSAIAGADVVWSSADETVATVDSEGVVTAINNGETNVTATHGPATASTHVTVGQVAAAVEVAPATDTLRSMGATSSFSATVRDAQGALMDTASVIWSTGDAGVATVDGDGLVTAVGNGSTAITAMSGAASGSSTIVVAVPTMSTVSAAGPATADVGVEFAVTLTLDIGDGAGIEPGAVAVQVSWDPALVSMGDWAGFSSSESWQAIFSGTEGWVRLVVTNTTGIADGQVLIQIPFTAIAGSGSDVDLDLAILDVVEALSFDVLTSAFEAVGTTVSIN